MIKLLSTSNEVGLRRLRSYAASIGGGALIYNDYNKLIYDLASTKDAMTYRPIVIIDAAIPINEAQVSTIKTYGRVFFIRPPGPVTERSQDVNDLCSLGESYMDCSLTTFMESPVIRVCMAQLCHPTAPIYLENMLRWGHATTEWKASSSIDLSSAGLSFIRKFNLMGDWRRLMEMFCHFVAARSKALDLKVDSVRFASDGLLLAAVAICPESAQKDPGELINDLRMHSFPIVSVNRREGGDLEFAAFYTPFHPIEGGKNTVVLTFNKDVGASATTLDLDKVG